MKLCNYCSNNTKKYFILTDKIFCSKECINKFILDNKGLNIYCLKCNKYFKQKYLGSHVCDINNKIHFYCSLKCQFKS